MIKGLIMDIGDVIYDCRLYKKTSPLLMRLKIEQLFLILSMATLKITRFVEKNLFDNRPLFKSPVQPSKNYCLRPQVLETIKTLHEKGIKIAFLSDSLRSSNALFERMVNLGIADYIDGVISSAEILSYKPHSKAYRKALDFLGIDKNEALFVGHAKDELSGAQKFGVRTIGYNLDVPVETNFYAKDFSDILKIVGGLNDKGSDNGP